MSNALDLESIRDSMNWSDTELLLVGYCVASFERVTFLISSLLEGDHKKRLTFLDMTGGPLAEVVEKTFGKTSIGYKKFKGLVDDRNAIIHAFGFPNFEEERLDRLYLKKGAGTIEKKIDEKFMRDFIKRCFDFFPILDFNEALKKFRQERKK